MSCNRLIVANHIDPSLLKQPDQRTFTQRVFWLLEEGDVVIVSSEPDRLFLKHVCGYLGISDDSLTFILVGQSENEGRVFEPRALLEPLFLHKLEDYAEHCTELVSLWPSVQVAELAQCLGIEHVYPGSAFFSQGGAAFANSKSSFRVLAASAEVPIPKGGVCQTQEELPDRIQWLLKGADGVMVKQSHNGAGAGCAVISKGSHLVPRTAGSIWTNDLGELEDSMESLWHWSSVAGRFPVVVEELCLGYRTVWFEFESRDDGVALRAIGGLEYEAGKMVREHTPLQWDVHPVGLEKARIDAHRLASSYHAIGYRGYLSADGLINDDGDYVFTEMNARIGGSLPIYGGVWERVVHAGQSVDRYVVQHLSPNHWPNLATEELLRRLDSAGLLYDQESRTGAVLGIPPLREIGNGSFLLIIVAMDAEDQNQLFSRIETALGAS
ncbi:hypothetical protein ACFPK9_07880 [Rubritalea spongiae]|uniref:ATP-grasp domain-containing protein n=1 Tax=Rubritalea spongiae TaxID=430797 RepID=A0ABW5E0A4_9BACT